MAGAGTLINIAGILVGGLTGMTFGKIMKPRYQEILMLATGVCVLFIGMGGALENMLTITDGQLSSGGTLMIIICFALGSLLGEWLNIERQIARFGEWLKIKTGSRGDATFVDGFVTASMTICIGAMAVVGAIQDGIFGDYSVLAAKAVIDLILILVMTASMGRGCMFAAIPVGVFQGCITLLARLIQPLMTEQALANLSLTGSIMIFCIGINLVWNRKIRVVNMLPTIVLAVAWAFFPF